MSDAMDARPTREVEPLLASFWKFFNTSIGAKVLMAVTGLGLWLFIVAHLAGNLFVYGGQDTYNHYAEALKGNPPLLWGVRLALIAGFPIHIWAAMRTSALNRAARPQPYMHTPKTPATTASKTMLISGLVVLTFFIYHLAHFTWHLTNPDHVSTLPNGSVDAYSMLVRGFQVPWIAAIYLVGQVLLAGHLSHGLYSLFQHLGLWGKSWTPFLKNASLLVGYGICAAFASIPLAVLFGLVKLP